MLEIAIRHGFLCCEGEEETGTRRTKEVKRKSTKKTISKVCSYLLTAVVVVSGLTLSPITTLEAQAAATTRNVNLNVSNSIAGLALWITCRV